MGHAARYTCNSCNRPFTNEFFNEQDPTQLCLFCLIQNNNKAANGGQADSLHSMVEALTQENRKLKEEVNNLKALLNSRNCSLPPQTFPQSNTPTSPLPRPPPFRYVDNGNHSENSNTISQMRTPTSNRYSLLRDEMSGDVDEEEYCDSSHVEDTLIGDSLVRGLGMALRKVKKSPTTIYVYPGAKIENIQKRMENFVQPEKKSMTIINVGSNNVFQKSVASQEVIERYRSLIGTLKDRCNNITMIGIMPRMFESDFRLSRAIGINDKLSLLCNEANIVFIDPWLEFSGRKDLFGRDGVHLNYIGKASFATFISKQLTIHRKRQQNFR